ncbi:hypothetical protein Lal_00024009 [Lupinus albus]|nr:hypothetical protein Lal_00024009 [Lupinus albus]
MSGKGGAQAQGQGSLHPTGSFSNLPASRSKTLKPPFPFLPLQSNVVKPEPDVKPEEVLYRF